MAESTRVYLSPSVLYAFVDRADPKHNQADAYFRFFAEHQYRLFTDIQSVMDCYGKLYAEIGPSLGKDFLRSIFLSDINIVYPDQSDIKASLKALIAYRSNELTFQDALIAVLAFKRDIDQICTLSYLHPLFGQTVFYLPI